MVGACRFISPRRNRLPTAGRQDSNTRRMESEWRRAPEEWGRGRNGVVRMHPKLRSISRDRADCWWRYDPRARVQCPRRHLLWIGGSGSLVALFAKRNRCPRSCNPSCSAVGGGSRKDAEVAAAVRQAANRASNRSLRASSRGPCSRPTTSSSAWWATGSCSR